MKTLNTDYVRALDDRSLAKALLGGLIKQYCTSPDPAECDHKWDAELDCSCCEACLYRWLKEERRDEH
jgi:hypothetical protein